jgi:hypothetical protein
LGQQAQQAQQDQQEQLAQEPLVRPVLWAETEQLALLDQVLLALLAQVLLEPPAQPVLREIRVTMVLLVLQD